MFTSSGTGVPVLLHRVNSLLIAQNRITGS